MNHWDQVKAQLRDLIPSETYSNWILPTKGELKPDGTLTLRVPDEAAKVVLEEDYGQLLEMCADRAGIAFREIEFAVGDTTPSRNDAVNGSAHVFTPSLPHDNGFQGLPTSPALVERYSFDNFVVGPCNQFAHAACLSVATRPASKYNPLFLYGGSGVGKTHLMHAIGLSLSSSTGGLRVVYTSSERFVNDMVNCIKQERMASFHAHYRSADVLLIDDIHIIAGKERTQEEFFHTFNDLYEHKKQIVISSDSAPKEIPGLVERLRSRFEWGLMVDMQPPDLETKMAILDKKAEAEGTVLPEDVRIYIATKAKSNVRELEGALVKVLAYSSLTSAPVTLAMAKRVLAGLGEQGEKKVTIDAIQKAVASRFKLQQHQLRQRSNVHSIAYPRQVAMYLAKELTSASLAEIGRAFGGKHHTTVLHSVQKIANEAQTDPEINKLIHNLTESLK
jgi:chromosomal replication initiator protein